MMKAVSKSLLIVLATVFLVSCGEDFGPISVETTDKLKSQKNAVTPTSRKKAGPVENIDSAERIAAARLMEAQDRIGHEIKIFMAEVRGAFDEKKFDVLEAKAKELRASKAIFGDGSWKIYRFYLAVDNRFHSGDDGYLTDLETHQEWEKAYPDSLTQKIALAEMLTEYAWYIRGSGYADTVTPEKWKIFKERISRAEKVIIAARNHEEKDPYLWQTAVRTGLGKGYDKKSFDAIVAESRKYFPKYWHVETSRAYSLLPRWYGEKGDWEAFAKEASEQPDGLGAETYARIVISMMGYYGNVYRDSPGKPSWEITKEGLDIMKQKYPASIKVDNYCARLGTLGSDRDYAKSAFDRLGDEYVKSIWKKPERFVHFRGWAQTGKW